MPRRSIAQPLRRGVPVVSTTVQPTVLSCKRSQIPSPRATDSEYRIMRALIVDDSRPIRRIESDILKELGFETADASNGKEALDRLQGGPLPDVVLVDWNMPEMD